MSICKYLLALLMIFLFAGLAGCGRASIQVAQVGPEESVQGSETLDIRNCDSNDDMDTTLAAEAPVKMEISIPEQATVLATGSTVDIPEEIRAELRAQVESAYQSDYEQAVASAEGVALTIPGHKIHMVKIHWAQQMYRADISLSIDQQPCSVSYVYTIETPELDSITVMACTA